MSPGSVVERAESLEKSVGLLNITTNRAALADALRTRRGQLNEREPVLAGLGEIRRHFKVHGISTGAKPIGVAGAREETRARHAAFTAEPETIMDPANSSFRYEYLTKLDNIRDRTLEQLLLGWRTYLREIAPELRDELLDVLGRIGQLREPVQGIRDLKQKLDSYEASLPQNETAIADAKATAEELRKRWAELPVGDIDEDVMRFLQAAVEPNGAPIGALTSEVQAWLTEHSLFEGLRVSFR